MAKIIQMNTVTRSHIINDEKQNSTTLWNNIAKILQQFSYTDDEKQKLDFLLGIVQWGWMISKVDNNKISLLQNIASNNPIKKTIIDGYMYELQENDLTWLTDVFNGASDDDLNTRPAYYIAVYQVILSKM